MKYRFQGTIKVIKFADARVSVLLENTTFMSNEGDWKQWVDWKLIEGGKYKKGDVWVSAFEQSAPQVFQACKMIEKGSEVELEIYKGEKDFLNINNMNLKVPEKDVNEDLKPPDMPTGASGQPPFPEGSDEEDRERILAERSLEEKTPSSTQRDPDSPEAQAEKMIEEEAEPLKISVNYETTAIIRECCVKAVCSGMRLENENDAEVAVAIAVRLEEYVLTGK